MSTYEIPLQHVLAEVLRLQRWAGGDSIDPARIFGLTHGFQKVLENENAHVISRETQDKVEDLLEEVEAGKQPTNGPSIKSRLHQERVSETDAADVMQLCHLQGRFVDGVEKIISGQGSVFSYLAAGMSPELDWLGALHYMELVDCTEGNRNSLHGVFSPCVPRVGEIVTPENGTPMTVVGIDHVISSPSRNCEGRPILIPHVLLEPIEGQAENE